MELDLGLVAGVTDRGLRHSRNEDAMALAAPQGPAGPMAVAVVCDGVSAPRADEASLMAVRVAARMLVAAVRAGDDPPPPPPPPGRRTALANWSAWRARPPPLTRRPCSTTTR